MRERIAVQQVENWIVLQKKLEKASMNKIEMNRKIMVYLKL